MRDLHVPLFYFDKYFFSFWFQMNVGVRKLADNLQTVKTVLGMKIQSEQKLVGIFVSGFFKHNF